MLRSFCFLVLWLLATLVLAQNNWQPVGPIQFPVDISGQINGIGRTTQLKFHHSDPNKLYAATASGGLWISYNGGQNWTLTGTDKLPNGQLASVCVDYTNDQILYIGTGDPNYYGTSYGIYKSSDGGQTWNPANNGIGNLMALELLMSPNDHLTLIAATNNGIWKTTDGGASWTQKLNSGQFTDMKFKPGNANIMYAVTFDSYYRSTDMGDTWTQITTGLTSGNATLGDGCRLGVSAASPDMVYVAAVKGEGTVFRSTDAGLTFSLRYYNPSVSLTGYDQNGGGQGNYNFCLDVNPQNAEEVYTSSHVVWKSTDGGQNWNKLTNWWANLHTDMHQFAFSPYVNGLILNMNDGGIFKSTNGGSLWAQMSDGLEATECYHGATSPVHPQLVSIGTQDNGELFYFNGNWKTNRGGDWTSKMWFDYLGNGNVYYPNGWRRNVSAQGGEDSVQLPIENDSRTVYAFTHLKPNVAVAGSKKLYRTTNLNAANASNIAWTLIYNNTEWVRDIEFVPDNDSVVYVVLANNKVLRCDNIYAPSPNFTSYNSPGSTAIEGHIAPLSNTSNKVYMTCGSKVYSSTDRGQTWTNFSGSLPNINLLNLYWDRFSNDESLYTASATGVYYRNTAAIDWLAYSNGLPSIAHITDLMLYNEGNAASKLRVSYYGRGVWESGLYNPAGALPYTQFYANKTQICMGETVQFNDATLGNPVAWSWSFPGGTPATSTAQNPTVTYPSPGNYTVTLLTTNANGNDNEVKTDYMGVLANPMPISAFQSEYFEGAGLPVTWTTYNEANDNLKWEITADAGGYDTSQHCIRIDNYNINGTGQRDEFRLPVIHVPSDPNVLGYCKLLFDVAYTTYPGYTDSLLVWLSVDCGQTRTPIYYKGGNDLATAPELANFFVPSATEWRTDTLDLTPYITPNSEDLWVGFQNIAGYSNVLYLDNIRFDAVFLTDVAAPQMAKLAVEISPNPNNGSFSLKLGEVQPGTYKLRILDLGGKLLYEETAELATAAWEKQFDFSALAKGTYLLELWGEKGKVARQWIKE